MSKYTVVPSIAEPDKFVIKIATNPRGAVPKLFTSTQVRGTVSSERVLPNLYDTVADALQAIDAVENPDPLPGDYGGYCVVPARTRDDSFVVRVGGQPDGALAAGFRNKWFTSVQAARDAIDAHRKAQVVKQELQENPPPAQRQDSLTDQLDTVHRLALAAGCYDAADWIERNTRDA